VDLQSFLSKKRTIVEEVLRSLSISFAPVPGPLKEAMEYSLFSKGKRIRPILALLACEAGGGADHGVLPFACALEMIHTYSLIHDDLPSMDNDDLRRGRPTCHKVFGEAIALLAGDALLTEAFRVMTDRECTGRIDTAVTSRIVFEVAQAAGAKGMVGGQAVDVTYEGKEGSKEIVNYIHENKTTAMIRAAVRVGAIAAQTGERELEQFSRYGEAIGFAFQIKDDLLDVEGDEIEVGKRLKKDAGKQTYVRYYGVDGSKAKIDELIRHAVESMAFLGPKGTMLVELARFVGERSF
jgi:geranylgeranyl diphosphate synthase, type II